MPDASVIDWVSAADSQWVSGHTTCGPKVQELTDVQCAMDAIWEVEREVAVKDLVIDGVRIWPLLRIYLQENLLVKFLATRSGNPMPASTTPASQPPDPGASLAGSSSLGSWQSQKNELRRLLATLGPGGWSPRRGKGKNPALALFLSYSNYRDRIGELWVDRFCDPIIQSMAERGYGYVFLERQTDTILKRPALTEAHYVNRELAVATVGAKMRRHLLEPITRRLLEEARGVWSSMGLPQEFPTTEWISARYAIADSLSEVYLRWIRKHGVRIGISASYYSITGLAFNLACSRVGIPSVDIQHGSQIYDHSGYAAWSSIPQEGYEMLPKIFWCWSEVEKLQIESWSEGLDRAHVAVVGGNVWHEFCLRQKPTASESKRSRASNILVTLQPWPLDIRAMMAKVIELTPPDWVWWFRLHPQMRERRHYQSLELFFRDAGNIRIREATDTPLPMLLPNMDLHITANSSSILEAAQLGVPSIITDSFLIPTYQIEIDRGMAAHAETPEDVAALARRLMLTSKRQSSAHEGHLEAGMAALYAAAGV